MKENINNLSRLQDLKKTLVEKNVSASAITTLEKALRGGMVFKRPADLGILNLPVADIKIVEDAVNFGSAAADGTVKTFQYSFRPVGNEQLFYGYQFVITYINKDRFTVSESYPIEDNRLVYVDLDIADISDGSKVSYQVKSAFGEYTFIALGNSTADPKEEVIEVDKGYWLVYR